MKSAVLCLSVVIFCIFHSPIHAQTVPSSYRSREVISRIKPRLQKQLSAKGMKWGAPIHMRIFKQEMRLEVWLMQDRCFRLFKTYPICTYGGRGLGPKTAYGDGRAPEGFYYITPRQMNPYSSYHLAFDLGYPNAYDRRYGRTGSALMVHGNCVSIGCFAMSDSGMEEIYTLADAALNHGQPYFRIHIFPFRMTPENMEKYSNTAWNPFWQNLKQGYDLFMAGNVPPDTQVRNNQYMFSSLSVAMH